MVDFEWLVEGETRPIQTTKPLWAKYRAKAAAEPPPKERFQIDRTLPVRIVQDNPIYAGLIEEMDNATGRVLKKLDELGLASNTIVVLTGDNGGVVSGDSFSSSQLPYRGGKGRQWEGGTRVPVYIRAPGITTPGSACDTPVIGIDYFPTLLQLAGVTNSPKQIVDGVSLVPLLKGSKISPRPRPRSPSKSCRSPNTKTHIAARRPRGPASSRRRDSNHKVRATASARFGARV